MSYRDDFHIWNQSIEKSKRVPRRKYAMTASEGFQRITLRGLRNGFQGIFQSQQEASRRKRTPFRIPVPSRLRFPQSVGMPPYLTRSHGKVVP